MCVTLVSSVSFLCILKAKYGNKFLQERVQVRRLTIVFGIAFLLRIVYNILCLTSLTDSKAYTILSAFVYVICIAFPLLYVFTQHLLEIQKPEPSP